MRFLHFADLHLDAPFAWARPETARLRRRNRREALTRILALADEENVDAVLCAGDLFEHDRFTPDTVTFLRESFARTDRPIYLAAGNHDWYSSRSPYALVEWSPNVHVFTEATLTPIPLADGLTLWGAAHRAPANTDGFFADFRPDRGGIHLALAHASERSALPFQESGKELHAPFDATELEAAGIAHAFLGHYHVARDRDRYTYPGNPDPLSFGETDGRGAVLTTVADDGTVSRVRRSVAVSQVHDRQVALDGCYHVDDVVQRVAMSIVGLSGSVRLTLTGEVPAELPVETRSLNALGEHLDGLVIRTSDLRPAYDIETIGSEMTVRGQFVRDAQEIVDDERRRKVLITGLRALEGRGDLEVA
ncbi:MAG TPA: metallophosphoesterase [Candidatus Limnocylindria bacterium]|jgi:DNA repair exonuclease SbcCD nuclease subunit